MKQIFSTFICLVLGLSAISAQTLTTEYDGCDGFTVNFSGAVLTNLHASNSTITCPSFQVRRITAGAVPGATYSLEKKNANGSFSQVTSTSSNTTTASFSGLSAGTYRVRMQRRNTDNQLIYSQFTPCTGTIVGRRFTTITQYLSPEIEIGTPVPSNIVFPAPTGNPAKICYSAIDGANELLLLNGEASFGERSYFVAVFKDDLQGNNVWWAGTDWVVGKLSIVNLKSLNMTYEPGYKYTVQVALGQAPCTSWVDSYTSFIVDGNCRESEDGEPVDITVYPNPATDEIRFEGLESYGNAESTVQLLDMMGKLVKTETLNTPFDAFSMADVPAGTYLVTILNGDQRIIKKVIRQ
jgi:hypothetical protein